MNKDFKFMLNEEVAVRCRFSPPKPGMRTLANGDPGCPDEPADVTELNVSVLINWLPIDITDRLSEAQRDWIEDQCVNEAHDQGFFDPPLDDDFEDCEHFEKDGGICTDCGEDLSGFEGMRRYDEAKSDRYDD